MIRAVKTGAKADSKDFESYKKMLIDWKLDPALASRLNVLP
jgi:hypothetical protein